MDNCVVLGWGTVGRSTSKMFSIRKHFDRDPKRNNISLKRASEIRYHFVCLPTEVRGGRYKTDEIENLIVQIRDMGRQNVFVIRSTVYPGFAKYIQKKHDLNNIISNPEFLTESTWEQDALNPDFALIGGEVPNYINDVEGVYRSRFKGLDVFKTDTVTAELAKLAINGFYATKVVYANQMYDYAKTTGANYEKIKEVMYKRRWIGKNHLDIHHKGGRGAGGRCLPKDLNALAEYSGLPFLHQVRGLNQSYLQSSKKIK